MLKLFYYMMIDFIGRFKGTKNTKSVDSLVNWASLELDEMLKEMWDILGCFYYLQIALPGVNIRGYAEFRIADALYQSLAFEEIDESFASWSAKQKRKGRKIAPVLDWMRHGCKEDYQNISDFTSFDRYHTKEEVSRLMASFEIN